MASEGDRGRIVARSDGRARNNGFEPGERAASSTDHLRSPFVSNGPIPSRRTVRDGLSMPLIRGFVAGSIGHRASVPDLYLGSTEHTLQSLIRIVISDNCQSGTFRAVQRKAPGYAGAPICKIFFTYYYTTSIVLRLTK